MDYIKINIAIYRAPSMGMVLYKRQDNTSLSQGT